MGKTFLNEYRQKCVSDIQAAALLNSGDTLVYGAFLGRPVDFDRALAGRRDELRDVNIYWAGGMGPIESIMSDPGHDHFVGNVCSTGALTDAE